MTKVRYGNDQYEVEVENDDANKVADDLGGYIVNEEAKPETPNEEAEPVTTEESNSQAS